MYLARAIAATNMDLQSLRGSKRELLKSLFISAFASAFVSGRREISHIDCFVLWRNITKLIFCFAYFYTAQKKEPAKLIIGREGKMSINSRISIAASWTQNKGESSESLITSITCSASSHIAFPSTFLLLRGPFALSSPRIVHVW